MNLSFQLEGCIFHFLEYFEKNPEDSRWRHYPRSANFSALDNREPNVKANPHEQIRIPMSNASSATSPSSPIPSEADLERIKASLIEHSQHVLCETAFQNIDYQPGLMSALVGPAGVGKTTLLSSLAEKLRKKFTPTNPGEVPVILTYMEASEEGIFNWKNFYRSGLLPHLNAPLDQELESHSGNPALPSARRTKDDLRNLVAQNIRSRNTRVIIIDEAHHVALGRPAPIMIQQLEVLKSFATICNAHLILCGPYQLMSSISLNPQLTRRMTVVHFPCYKPQGADRQRFYDALYSLANLMAPWSIELKLDADLDFFYQRSLGCIGLLKPWLDRAAKRAMEEGSAIITAEILEGTAKLAKELKIMAEDIREGQAKLKDTHKDWEELRDLLGYETAVTPPPRKGGKHSARPGDRMPQRDLAGSKGAAPAP